MKIAALIINWNGAADTLELIESIRYVNKNSEIEIDCFIVDNASLPDDLALLSDGLADISDKARIVFRQNTVNVGVPAAYNQCIQMAGLDYDYYLRLDNDVTVDIDGLLEMIKVFENQDMARIGIVGGNIKFYHRRSDDNGGSVSFDLLNGKTSVRYPDKDEITDGLLGCIELISRDCVLDLSPMVFLDKLFICTDESEMSLRARLHGFQTYYLAKLIGYHKGGQSTQKVPFLSNYYSARNWTYIRVCYSRGFSATCYVLAHTLAYIFFKTIRLDFAFPLGAISGFAMLINMKIDNYARSFNKKIDL